MIRVVLIGLIIIASAAVIVRYSRPARPAVRPRAGWTEGTYVGWTREKIISKLGAPTHQVEGHYGNPPAAWAKQFGRCETLVYESDTTTIYISVYKPDGDWVCFSSTAVPTGTQF